MSRCSSSVFTVNGRVGLVEEGSTLGSPATVMMSGACPPPAPSVWKAWMVWHMVGVEGGGIEVEERGRDGRDVKAC